MDYIENQEKAKNGKYTVPFLAIFMGLHILHKLMKSWSLYISLLFKNHGFLYIAIFLSFHGLLKKRL